MSQGAQEFERVIDSDSKQCAELVRELLELLEKENWTQDDIFGIRMAVEEAVMNAIKHGNCCEADKQVHILIEVEGNEFYARITDEGCGFSPKDVPDPRLNENLEKTTGRGVMLMKNFVDQVKYNDKGNVVELRTRRKDNA